MGLVLAAIVHACFHLIFLAQGVIFFYSGQLVGTSGRLLSPKPLLSVARIAAHSFLANARHVIKGI